MLLLVAVMVGLFILYARTGHDVTETEAPVTMTHRMMMLAIQLGLILFAAKIGGMVFARLHMPSVLGELVAGMLIGPFALGQFPFYGFPGGVFPLPGQFPISAELYGISSIAAIVLLFMAGLETDLRMLMRFSVAGSLVGLGGVTASFVLGDATAVIFGPLLLGKSIGFFHPTALFLGLISTATSVGITARVLSEKRKLDSPEGVTILVGAVIDDVLGIVLLAVTLSVVTAAKATGEVDWSHIGIIAGKAVGIWLAATAVVLLASRRIGFLLKLFGDRASVAVMGLGMALVLAGLFEEAGLAMIIGAYIAGLSISRTDISNVVRENLHPIYAFLVPIFFCVMGMLVNFKVVLDWRVLVFGAVYSLVAIAAKLIGCGVPAYFFQFNTLGAARVGFGMAPRCEVALVIAGIGLAGGVLDAQMFGVPIMMTLLSTLIAPPALVALFSIQRPGTRKPVVEEGAVVAFPFATREIAEFLLRKVLDVFEAEGFYVHLLDRDQQVYQLRKDSVVIGLQRTETTLRFSCDESETALVNTAVYEVVGELEQAIRELQKPVDKKAIMRRVQEAKPSAGRQFDLARYLSVGLLRPHLRAAGKAGVIDELLNVLHANGLLEDVPAARKAVMEREEGMSTGMEKGIAIPHGRTNAVNRLVCAVGLKPEGIDFGAFDGKPSTVFVLTLSPNSTAAPHVQFMSSISQILITDARERLLDCKTPEEMYAVLTTA